MKHFLISCLLLVLIASPSWGQKKVTSITKALVQQRSANQTPKQILEATRLFIGQQGHRPHAFFYKHYAKVPYSELSIQQQAETRLGQQINALLARAKLDASLNNTPTIQNLRSLIEKFPTQKKAKTPSILLTELRAFIDKNGYRPRAALVKNNTHIPFNELSPEEQEECLLGTAIANLLSTTTAHNAPEIDQIRQLLQQYSRREGSRLERLPQLIEDTQNFLATHQRRPRMEIWLNGYKFRYEELAPEDLAEVRLGRSIDATLRYARTHQLLHLPNIQTLQKILESYPNKERSSAPSAAQVLEQTQQFIATYGHRPKNTFFDEQGNRIALQQLDPQRAAESHLANLISFVLLREKEGKLIHEKEALQELHSLLTRHANLRSEWGNALENPLFWQHILTQLEAFISIHGRRPLSHIYRDKTFVAKHQLSAEELAEVQLGRHLNQILNKAKANARMEHPIIKQLKTLADTHLNKVVWNLPAIANQLEQFIQTHGRIPHSAVYHDKQRLKTKEMSPEEQEEIRLGRQINSIRYKATQDTKLQEDPSVQKILELLEPFSRETP